jgi:hypothetical protein
MKGNQKNVQGWAEVIKTANFQASSLGGYASSISVALGNALLPDVQKIGKWAASVITYFQSHPLVSKIASDAVISLFVGAITLKLAKGIKTVFDGAKGLFGFIGKQIGTATGATFQNQQLFYLREIAYNTATTKGKGLLAKAEDDLKKLGGAGLAMKSLSEWAAKLVGGGSLVAGLGYSAYATISGLFKSYQTGQFPGSGISLFGGGQGASTLNPTSASYVHDVTVKTKTGIKVYVTH